MTDPQLPASFAEAQPRLALRLYGAATLGVRRSLLEAAGVPAAMPAVVPAAGDVSVGVDVDLEDGRVVPLTAQNLTSWGVDVDAAASAARERLVGTDLSGISAIAEGVYLIQNDQFVAAALLAPKMAEAFPVTGDVTMLPASGPVALCTGSAHAEGLVAAYELLDELSESDVPIETTRPLVLRDGRWEELDVVSAHPSLAGAVALTTRQAAVRAYDAQADALTGDAFVARAKLFQKPGEDPVTVSTWTRGVETLLPETDQVLVVGDDDAVTPYSFASFLDSAGDAVTRLDTVPARYRVSGSAAA